MVSGFLGAHPLFDEVRLRILSSELFFELIRTQIICYAAKLLSTSSEYDAFRYVPFTSNSTQFSLALQLLTLSVQFFVCCTTDNNSPQRFFSELLSTRALPCLGSTYATPVAPQAQNMDSGGSVANNSDADASKCKICNEVSGAELLFLYDFWIILIILFYFFIAVLICEDIES